MTASGPTARPRCTLSTRSTSAVRLQARDLELFELLLQRRVETLGHIHLSLFGHTSEAVARNRLVRLRQGGYLQRIAVTGLDSAVLTGGDLEHKVFSVYELTPKGLAALRLRHRAGAELRGRPAQGGLTHSSIPHQLAVNRCGDWLGTALIGEHLLDSPAKDRRHRPDAAYLGAADSSGRSLVLLEVDLGNYTRSRILGKVRTFLADDQARGALFVTPNAERAAQVAGWIRERHGDAALQRIQVVTFSELQAGRLLDASLTPDGGAG